MKTLETLRQEINEKDRQIKKLLDERFALCRDVGIYKIENNMKVLDTSREQAILEAIAAEKNLYGKEIAEVYRTIMAQSREIQLKIRQGE